jgi:hypothetical protein
MLMALIGSMNCLTTLVGIFFFGARELNPLVAGLVSSSLPVFVAVKLAVAVFVLAEKPFWVAWISVVVHSESCVALYGFPTSVYFCSYLWLLHTTSWLCQYTAVKF